jgi:hypothetical protein
MNNLTPIIFLVPVIALTLVITLYVLLLKKTTDKKPFKKFVFTLIVLAFSLNLTWELLQIPLYNATYSIKQMSFCALASVADVIMELLLYFGFAFIFRNIFWVKNLKWRQVVAVVLVGGIGAILSEIRHLSLGTWKYSEAMPIIPIVNVGLSPVLQFMILPLLTYIVGYQYFLKSQPYI